jgi:hypothetical protein
VISKLRLHRALSHCNFCQYLVALRRFHLLSCRFLVSRRVLSQEVIDCRFCQYAYCKVVKYAVFVDFIEWNVRAVMRLKRRCWAGG